MPPGITTTITPSLTGYTFTPTDRTLTNITSDQPGQDFTGTALPEINLKQGTTDIPDGTGSYDFGTVNVGADTTTIFTIENAGPGDLILSGTPKVEISGTYAADFTITQQPASSIGSGASTTFEITFAPGDGGARTATVSIANNDSDENPYTFMVTGTGQGNSYLLWTR